MTRVGPGSGVVLRQGAVAAGLGLGSGGVAVITVWAIEGLRGLVWSGPDARWYVFLVIMVGGGLIALLQHGAAADDLAAQVRRARNPDAQLARDALVLAAVAIVAVGFGGAIGPEAGILALVGQLSALTARLLARNAAERRLIGEAGTAGALGGLYGSPPGGALVAQDDREAPRWQLFLAGLFGLGGFLALGSVLLGSASLRVALPAYTAAGDGTDLLFAVLPALAGGATGLLFAVLLPRIRSLLALAGPPAARTLVGSALFGLLAAAFPIVRFSGHHELDALLHWGETVGMAALVALAVLKTLALTLCLASGWRGGAIFPLLFAGAAAGGAVVALLPATPLTVALVAGIGAAMTVGLGKPVGAMLVALFVVGPVAIWPLCVGVSVGWALSRLVPDHALH